MSVDAREQAVQKMWQHIQSLQIENRNLRAALESLGHSDTARSIYETSAMDVPPFEVEQLVFAQRAVSGGAMGWPVARRAAPPAPPSYPAAPPMPRPPARAPVPFPSAAPTAPATPGPANVDIGVVRQLTVEQLNGLPYGVVVVDREGTVLVYNDTESRLAAVPRDRVLMRNFFRDVAPCTQVKEFEGRFQAFARGETRSAVEQFDFVFNFASGAQQVTIIFTPGRARGTFNILMTRR
jgi:photoactive yellow protein